MARRLAVTALALSLVAGVALASVSSYQDLLKFFPNLPGWTAEKPEGMTMDSPQGKMITATREYKQGDKSFSATIMLGNSATMAWAPFQTGMTMETSEVLMKTTTYKGFKAGINYLKKDKSGGIVVQLSTQNPTAAFVVNFESLSYEDALKLLDNFDLKGMASAIK